ncbi:hypothetical protein HMPREF1544_02286 [Mucor circinelloides 1006PhL]|uniref:Helitron helicase-like domain-containing protein n=1 Tax=Mucor circinelloides f. circinelloides (strain 1006PhL) TaxID=1220926 RepID=S2K660_MUCC1|nr:hypothetical protein HMPREF1544_02286 [Mucor circinelloides 1006PhL]
MCCKQGKVSLEKPLPNPPETLRALLTSSDDESRAKQNAQYSGFNFGAYTFRVQGGTYHRIPPLVPQYGYGPQYAKVYFTDPEYQGNIWRGIYSQLHTTVIDRIQQMLLAKIPFAWTFENARQQFADNQTDFHISINGRATATMGRTYSAPTADDEVVVVAIAIDPPSINDPNYVAHLKRDAAVFRRNGHVEHMKNECHRAYDPMHYALMFPPRGENDWRTQMALNRLAMEVDDAADENQKKDAEDIVENDDDEGQQDDKHGTKISLCKKCDVILRLSYSICGGYVLYVKVEHRLADATVTDSTTTSTEEIGRRQTILPSSSHVESPRAMHQQLYQESMVIVSVLGRPSYFIIFTCNPHWVEITRELLLRNGGKAPPADKPDYSKQQLLMSDIKIKPYIFGNVTGFTRVVEFQERGLPHAHTLVIVDEQSRLTPETYDKNMTHNPCCGKDISSHRPCLDDNVKCT